MPAPIPVGMLRNPMTLKNPSNGVDSVTGQRTHGWSGTSVLWCHIEQAQTTEVVDDGGVSVRSNFRILASWHPDVTCASRLEWSDNGNTRTFNIKGCWDRDQRRRTLEIDAVEVVS
jgi:head-tail adaptor